MSLTDTWLDWLEHDRARSPNTVAAYRRTLKSLAETCDPATATRDDIEAWWAGRTHLSRSTRNNELSAVRAFYKWCRTWEHRPPTDDPTHRLEPPKIGRTTPHPLSRHDLRTLLEVLPDDSARAVALGCYGGLRVSEAATLHWRDVDREMMRIRLAGKGDKERLVGMSALLLDYLLPEVNGYVVTGTTRRLSAQSLQQKVNRAIKAAGVDATFHACRHRFGTMAIAGGAPLLAVSRAMGHASPATTAIYVAASDSDLDLIAEAVTR